MKIATWNVNGIRARQGQVSEWLQGERPDVVCLQEIKATCAQVPAGLCEPEGYWSLCREGRETIASIYAPNGGKDFAASMRFLDELRTRSAPRPQQPPILGSAPR